MTKEEAKAYAKRLLSESGVPDTDITQYEKLFDNERFANGFIPRPEVDRSLDAERQKAKGIDDYYRNDWLPKAQATVKTWQDQKEQADARIALYESRYGKIEDGSDARHAAQATGLSLEKVDELVNKRLQDALSNHGQAAMDLMDIREDYIDKFKKRMPVKDFEKYVAEQQKAGQYNGLRSAYKDFIEEDLEKQRAVSQEARDKQIREEAVRDFAARNKIPTDARPREAHLLLDRERVNKENASGSGKSSRDEFMDILNDPNPETLRSRYPV